MVNYWSAKIPLSKIGSRSRRIEAQPRLHEATNQKSPAPLWPCPALQRCFFAWCRFNQLVGGWTNPKLKNMLVKMASSSPIFGVKKNNIWVATTPANSPPCSPQGNHLTTPPGRKFVASCRGFSQGIIGVTSRKEGGKFTSSLFYHRIHGTRMYIYPTIAKQINHSCPVGKYTIHGSYENIHFETFAIYTSPMHPMGFQWLFLVPIKGGR